MGARGEWGPSAVKSEIRGGTSQTPGELRELTESLSVERLERLPRSAVVEALLRRRGGEHDTSGGSAPRWHSAV